LENEVEATLASPNEDFGADPPENGTMTLTEWVAMTVS